MHSALSALGKLPAANTPAAAAATSSAEAPAGFEDLLSLVRQALAAMPAVRDAALTAPDAGPTGPLTDTALLPSEQPVDATGTPELPLPRLAGLDGDALPAAAPVPAGTADAMGPRSGNAPVARPALQHAPDLPPIPAHAAAESAKAGEAQPAPPLAARNPGAVTAATPSPESPLVPAPAVEAPRTGTAGSLTPDAAAVAPARIVAALGLAPRGGRSGGAEERAPVLGPGMAAAAPTATTAAPPASSHSLPTPAGSEAWPKSVADVLIAQAPGQGTGRAQLQLRPEHLGGLAIEILQDGDRIELRVNADTAAGRQAFEESLPKLRALFAEQGLQLGNTNVSGGDAQQRGDASRRQAADGEPAADAPPGGHTAPQPRPAQPRGLLDYYA